MSSLVSDQFWKDFAGLVSQAKSVFNSPPVVGDANNRVMAALIIACADLHIRVKADEAEREPLVKVVPQ